MTTHTAGKMSLRKKIIAAVTGVVVTALLIGGAFAWTDFSQNAINRFRGNADNDALLHDDFEPGVNKDVYVENTGKTDIIVRVKFTEYFQIGNQPVIGGASDDVSTWQTHLFDQTNPIDCGLPTHEYYQWVMSGNQKVYKPGTGEIGNEVYTIGQTFPDGSTAKTTLPASTPITMAEYIANKAGYDAEVNGRWILDSDGWAYWSKLLAPGEATNLLLDDVLSLKQADDNYYYAINVVMQASNKTEAHKLLTDSGGNKSATDDGEGLIEELAGGNGGNGGNDANEYASIEVTTLPDKTEYTEGDAFDKTGMVVTATMKDGSKKVITDYTVSPAVLTSAGDSVTVTITSKGKSDTITVKVNPAAPGEPDDKLTFKGEYADDPSYTPPADEAYRIRFRQVSPRVYAFSTGANHEVGLMLSDILEGDVSGIKISRVQIDNISRSVDLTDTQAIADYTVAVRDGKLYASFLPTYAELFKDFPDNMCDENNAWPFMVPVKITLSNADGSKTGVFTINVMFMGMATYNGDIGN